MPTLYELERSLDKKMAEVERLARKHLAAATAENEKAERKLREEHEAMLAPYSPSAPPARDEAGRFEAPTSPPATPGAPTDERAQFARNKELMLQGLRSGG